MKQYIYYIYYSPKWSDILYTIDTIVQNGQIWSWDDEMLWERSRLFKLLEIHSAYHQHDDTCYKCKAWAPKARRPTKADVKKQTLDHPPFFYGIILFLCSFLFSLFKSFLCSNLSIWPDRPVVPNGSRCYISILDGLVSCKAITNCAPDWWRQAWHEYFRPLSLR